MTLWSDARNHLVDDALHATVMALVARVIGVEPGQFLAIAAIRPLIESLAHANTRIHFGAIGSRLLVGPRFHRLHHAAVIGGVPGLAAPDTPDVRDAADSAPRACNYAVLFPLWDVVGRTACFAPLLLPTGIGDARTSNDDRDHGRGFWQPQWFALRRMLVRRAPLTLPTPEEAIR
jgi:sterol desaturase/sphingolipid hydroxylase (fatty acid hydroxylase superfamily)